MSTITYLHKKFQSFSIKEVAIESLRQCSSALANLNVEQMNKGVKSDGNLMPDYSPVSVEKFGKPEGPIKLFDKGDFYRGWKVDVRDEQIFITSTDDKAEMLFKRYATKRSNLFGLSPLYRREFMSENLKKTFRANVHTATGL